jgi:uridine kinase
MGTIPGPSSRDGLVAGLAGLVCARQPGHVLRVAIDGPDASGKTTVADALAGELARQHAVGGRARRVIRAGIDGFHRPREARYRQGSLSPRGYYEDSFDYAALCELLLEPLGPGGSRWYQAQIFDHRTDTPRASPRQLAGAGAVLVFDGVFLLRPGLRSHWDLTVFVDVEPAEALRRALVRDLPLLGSAATVAERYQRRYLPGQRLYQAAATPQATADVVIDNTDPAGPWVRVWPAGEPLP